MHLLGVALAVCAVSQQGGAPSDSALPRAIHDAFVSNQKAFPFGRVSFTFTKGNASNDADARAGKFEPIYSAAGLYCFNGLSAKHEIVFSDEQI